MQSVTLQDSKACLSKSEAIYKAVSANEGVLSSQISFECSHEAEAIPAQQHNSLY